MIIALARDNVDFVDLMLDYGVSMHTVLTNQVLEFLYGYRAQVYGSSLSFEFVPENYTSFVKNPDGSIDEKMIELYNCLCLVGGVTPQRSCLPRKNIECFIINTLCKSLIQVENETFIEVGCRSLSYLEERFRTSY